MGGAGSETAVREREQAEGRRIPLKLTQSGGSPSWLYLLREESKSEVHKLSFQLFL